MSRNIDIRNRGGRNPVFDIMKGIGILCVMIGHTTWIPEFMEYYHISDPRPWYVRLVHRYLDLTQPYKNNIWVRAIDKALRKFIKK